MAREMKDSGIKWIGKIPKDWKRVKLGFLYSFSSGDTLTAQDFVEDGIYDVYGANGLRGKYDKSNLKGKHILIGRVGALCGNIHLVNSEVWVTEHALISYNLSDTIIDDYSAYLLLSMNLSQYASGTAQPVIASERIRKLYIPVPTIDEQQRIADFLKSECACIDAVIEQTRASIEEYKKLKQAIITQAVTKGICPNRPMKDSGIEWIGEIPQEWNVIKITRLLDYSHPYPIGDGDHGLIKTDSYISSGIPFIRVQNLGWGTNLSLDNLVYISEEDNSRIANSTLHPNDVLFAKTGATIGKTGIIPENIPVANTTSHIGKITVSPNYNAKLVFYVLSSYIGFRQFWEIAGLKATRPELTIDEIKSIRLVIPNTKEEQNDIVSYLENTCKELDKIINKKKIILSELESYKKSLIFEYVTGKKEAPTL